jgi:hypothetical protein
MLQATTDLLQIRQRKKHVIPCKVDPSTGSTVFTESFIPSLIGGRLASTAALVFGINIQNQPETRSFDSAQGAPLRKSIRKLFPVVGDESPRPASAGTAPLQLRSAQEISCRIIPIYSPDFPSLSRDLAPLPTK